MSDDISKLKTNLHLNFAIKFKFGENFVNTMKNTGTSRSFV